MRVIHFVPSAFEYFEDIRSNVFHIVEELDKEEVNSEIITLQYGAPTQTSKQAAAEQEVKRSYKGTMPTPELLESLSRFDIIHFHVPLLGFLGKFIKWKKLHPEARVVVSYYRPVRYDDLISWFVKWYNQHYLVQLNASAEAIIHFSNRGFKSLTAKMRSEALVFNAQKFVSEPLYEKNKELQLINLKGLSQIIIAIYSKLLYNRLR